MTTAIHDANSLALLAFNVGSNQFDINRGLTYISMRDQVLRARTLVNAAVAASLFDQRPASPGVQADAPVDYDVAVLGAGVGGMSVALAAIENGLRTLVIDKSGRRFELLRSGTDRLVSTTVYDWPANHFAVHEFPDLPPITPRGMAGKFVLKFPARAQDANTLAQHLELQVRAMMRRKNGKLLRFAMQVELGESGTIGLVGGRCVALYHPPGLPRLDGSMPPQVRTRIVVYAIGFGTEKVMNTSKPDVNASFWGYGSLTQDLARLAALPGPGKVNIQGGGDGGLQEALRFALGPRWQDLAAVAAELDRCVSPAFPAWESKLRDIMLAEDNAARAFMWGYSQDLVFESVDHVHQQVINALLKQARPVIDQWFAKVSRKQDLHITVYDKHVRSGRVYALNRFLFKLLVSLTQFGGYRILVDRKKTKMPATKGAIRVDRSGLSQMIDMLGTATPDDYLRRATLRAIPNQYGIVG